jgi:hypothetical protein
LVTHEKKAITSHIGRTGKEATEREARLKAKLAAVREEKAALERVMGERELGQQEELARIRVEVGGLLLCLLLLVEVDTGRIGEEGAAECSFNRGLLIRDLGVSGAR